MIISAIPFLIFAIWVKLDSKGKVIFKQERIGKDYKVFDIYKLRTMDNEMYDKKGKARVAANRMTRPGKIARILSIDEIPQLFNVLKGEMSFIGPRPLLPRYFKYFTKEELRRHDVKPGLTGLAQIKGRAFLDWDKRFKYDLFYVDNVSLFLDLKIMFNTFIAVLSREGTLIRKPIKADSLNKLRKKRNDDIKLIYKNKEKKK